jgi:predicted lipoprotein with Yx(FWY)xxD motif
MRGRMIRLALPIALVAVIGAGTTAAVASRTTSSGATVAILKTSQFGPLLVASNGHTLYRYTVDGKGVNRCSSDSTCNAYWPALVVKKGTKPTVGSGVSAKLVGTIAAAHGMVQITYAGYPLYYFSGDKKSGQENGQAFDKQWYVVNAAGAMVKQAVQAASSSSSSAGSSSSSSGSGGYSYG